MKAVWHFLKIHPIWRSHPSLRKVSFTSKDLPQTVQLAVLSMSYRFLGFLTFPPEVVVPVVIPPPLVSLMLASIRV